MAPAELQQVASGENEAFLTLKDGAMLTARTVVGADGANSAAQQSGYSAHLLGLSSSCAGGDYPYAGSARCGCASGVSRRGITAFLPLSDPHLCSIVWSLSPQEAERMQQASIDEFNQALNIAFDNRLGLCSLESERQAFPLTGRYARQFAAHRLALVGDAAHTIHPLAGQGLTLALWMRRS